MEQLHQHPWLNVQEEEISAQEINDEFERRAIIKVQLEEKLNAEYLEQQKLNS